MFDFWILSMNERNLNYIKKLNPKSSINLADNKIETKMFLEERWIWVPKTLAVISSKKQLSSFDLKSLKEDYFVIKPVFWSRWQGILIVKNLKNWKYKVQDNIVDESFLIDHMHDILNWDFSLNYWFDKILIEEKLIAWNWFEKFCDFWLADIRVIVYNMVPVAAMVRMPTKQSEWKANLSQGWIWLWIEVWSWIINTMALNWEVFTKSCPIEYNNLKEFEIPSWDDILIASSKTQFFVNLWYLALDWVVAENWPKILEINARAWLEIQNVCLLPLKKSLDKIKDLKISEPEKWVELSKSLFSTKLTSQIACGKILYLAQNARIISWDNEEEVILKVDLSKTKSYISKYLFEIFQESKDFSIGINENVVFENIKFQIDEKLDDNFVILWTNQVKDYFIKPEENLKKDILFIPKKANKNEINLLKIIDEKVMKLDKKVSLTIALKPTNFLWELDKFIELNWNYNPIFEYNFFSYDKIVDLENEILKLRDLYFKKDLELKSSFSKLFRDKLDEISNRLALIKSYKNDDFVKIEYYNNLLFWEIDKDLVKNAEYKLWFLNDDKILWKVLDQSYVVEYIKNYLDKNNLSTWVKVVLSTSNMSRISVTRKKWKVEVRVSADWVFKENELDWVIAHEIWVHLVRSINWKNTWWNILESWTANYLETEEWLAVYNSLSYFPEWYEKNAMYQNYYLIDLAKKLDFQDLAKICFKLKWNDYIKVFKTTIRFKKWIKDTSIKNPWAFFAKDKVYLDWYVKVKKWIENWWDIEKLMIGKIKIEDLDLIN